MASKYWRSPGYPSTSVHQSRLGLRFLTGVTGQFVQLHSERDPCLKNQFYKHFTADLRELMFYDTIPRET